MYWSGGDSAFYSHSMVTACLAAGAEVSITVRMDPAVKRAIAAIDDDAWTTINYTDALYDEHTGRWISRAEVAEPALCRVHLEEKGRQGAGPARGTPQPRPELQG